MGHVTEKQQARRVASVQQRAYNTPVLPDSPRRNVTFMCQSTAQTEPARRGVVGVFYRDDRFLVIRRSQRVRAPGAYCFPGGGVEVGETETIALIREMDEELSASVQILHRIWQCETPSGTRLGWWQVNLQPQSPFIPNPAEVESLHWLTLEQVLYLPGLLLTNRHFLAAVASQQVRLHSTQNG
ncbi:MAG: NUDIX domain-containing protein [Pirellulaceae bacterium]|nr:NUDIX domain-containing protein [Pirellulaceae bacterium]